MTCNNPKKLRNDMDETQSRIFMNLWVRFGMPVSPAAFPTDFMVRAANQ
jgi:hypothetical protein